jgi:hypothetical protein
LTFDHPGKYFHEVSGRRVFRKEVGARRVKPSLFAVIQCKYEFTPLRERALDSTHCNFLLTLYMFRHCRRCGSSGLLGPKLIDRNEGERQESESNETKDASPKYAAMPIKAAPDGYRPHTPHQ